MRICRTCKEEFKPSSGHKDCPKCRAKALPRKKCPECGRSIRYDRNHCIKCSKGKLNGNWKGGKTYHKAGYIMQHAPEHPRTNRKTQYVFEHILVMEKKLSRYLTKDESVHHKNGIKIDNRSMNLELWSKNHPAGSRVSDLLIWAKEISLKYGEFDDK